MNNCHYKSVVEGHQIVYRRSNGFMLYINSDTMWQLKASVHIAGVAPAVAGKSESASVQNTFASEPSATTGLKVKDDLPRIASRRHEMRAAEG